jgi:hypothetical protein
MTCCLGEPRWGGQTCGRMFRCHAHAHTHTHTHTHTHICIHKEREIWLLLECRLLYYSVEWRKPWPLRCQLYLIVLTWPLSHCLYTYLTSWNNFIVHGLTSKSNNHSFVQGISCFQATPSPHPFLTFSTVLDFFFLYVTFSNYGFRKNKRRGFLLEFSFLRSLISRSFRINNWLNDLLQYLL